MIQHTIRLSEVGEEGGKNYAGRIAVEAPPTFYKRMEAMPGARFFRGGMVWTMSKSYQSTCVIGGVAKSTGSVLQASAELAAWRLKEHKDWATLTALSQTLTSDIEFAGLYPHQVQDMEWLTFPGGPRGRLLLNEMGIGKTRPVIHAMVEQKLFPALVVCPKTVARLGWLKQLQATYPELRVGIAIGTPTARVKVFKAAAAGELDVVVTSWDLLKMHTKYEGFGSVALKRCVECGGPKFSQADKEMAEAEGKPVPKEVTVSQCQTHVKELNGVDWKLIVGDEVHRALNTTAATRLALGGLLKNSPDYCYRWFLTGTPLRSRPEGLWSLLNSVDPDGWPNKSKWVERYCEKGWDNDGYERIVGFNPETKAELDVTLRAISRRVLKAQVLDLPEKLRGPEYGLVHEVKLGMEQRRVYNEMKDLLIAQVKEGAITAANAMSKVGRLTFLANGTGYPAPDYEETGRVLLREPSAKIDELINMIREQELPGQFAIATTSRVFLELIVATLIKRGLYEEDDIGMITGAVREDLRVDAANRFQAGRIPVVAYTHAAGGVGIDLYAAEDLVLMERSWNSVDMSQSIDRVHRVGMPNRNVRIVDMIAEDTVDIQQLERLDDTAALVDEVTHDKEKLLALLGGK